MTTSQVEIQLIAMVTAVACALPGVFLILRRMAMMSDAISHTVLLGIVLAFFVVEDLNSPVLILGAAAVGVLTVSMVALLQRTRLLKEDASIGLVFPFLFSVAVILISRYAGQVHLDEDVVLLGELAFAPFDRFVLFGRDIGPRGFYVMAGILALNLSFILIFYKELKISTFDPELAASLGIAPGLLHYFLMSSVSITVVGAFDVVGSILVVALMVAPPMTAYLLVDRLPQMVIVSAVLGVLGAVSGYWLAYLLDASIAGSMASMLGVIFIVAFLFAPERGLIAIARRHIRQRWEFAQAMLLIHLLHHQGLPEAEQENHLEHLHEHLRWDPEFVARVVRRAERSELVDCKNDLLYLTQAGQQKAQQAIIR